MTPDEMAAAIADLTARVAALESKPKRTRKPAEPKAPREPRPAKPPPPTATDEEMDGPDGDPRVRFAMYPDRWPDQPDTHVGKRYSECEPAYLDVLAKMQSASAWGAEQRGEHDKARMRKRDALLARGWAARIRARGASFATEEEAVDFVRGAPDDGDTYDIDPPGDDPADYNDIPF